VEIRALRAEEGLAYREVRLRALRLAPQAFATSYAEEAAQPDAFWIERAERAAEAMGVASFVLDRGNGTLAGTAFVRVNEDPPHDAFIGAMWVDEDLRGAGWADALLDAAERHAMRYGATAAELWVEADNARAQRVYLRHGYAPTGIEQPAPQGGTVRLMRKELSDF